MLGLTGKSCSQGTQIALPRQIKGVGWPNNLPQVAAQRLFALRLSTEHTISFPTQLLNKDYDYIKTILYPTSSKSCKQHAQRPDRFAYVKLCLYFANNKSIMIAPDFEYISNLRNLTSQKAKGPVESPIR